MTSNSGSAISPALDKAVRPDPAKLFDMMEAFKPIGNFLGIGDPDVHRIGDQWWMFFGGFIRVSRTTFSVPVFRRAHRSVAMSGRSADPRTIRTGRFRWSAAA